VSSGYKLPVLVARQQHMLWTYCAPGQTKVQFFVLELQLGLAELGLQIRISVTVDQSIRRTVVQIQVEYPYPYRLPVLFTKPFSEMIAYKLQYFLLRYGTPNVYLSLDFGHAYFCAILPHKDNSGVYSATNKQ